MFRVYDKEKKEWVKGNVYLSPVPNSDLYMFKKNIFGFGKLVLLSDEKYITHKSTGMNDKNGFLVFEGDIVEAKVDEGKIVKGVVSFAQEFSAYVILCFEYEEYFTLGNEVSKYVEVIGNVFDGVIGEKETGSDV